MAFKFITLFAMLAVVSGSGVYDAPLVRPALSYGAPFVESPLVKTVEPVVTKVIEFASRPQYSFGYDVKDGWTGDFKNHHEVRDGDLVQGQYSLLDADGFKRTVDYSADGIHGFNAVVSREQVVAPEVPIVKVAAPTLPIVKSLSVAAPVVAPTLIKSSPLLSNEWAGFAPSVHNVEHNIRSYDDGQYRLATTLVKPTYAGAFTGYGPSIIKSTHLGPAYDDGQYRPLQYQAPYDSHYASKYGFV